MPKDPTAIIAISRNPECQHAVPIAANDKIPNERANLPWEIEVSDVMAAV
jgi:hypothetical protein